ncbi:MAG: hypothetical protein IT416_03885 [Candidatus Pacebacteria bacterium]|nr:hypothetical protein [Candidatus Paceibacterota bacterium]
MKKVFLSVVLLGSAILFAGCGKQNLTKQEVQRAANEKVGDTTKTGTISTVDGKYFLTEAGQVPKEIDSYAIDLSAYVGQKVTVTGQYSGDTLFVGNIE